MTVQLKNICKSYDNRQVLNNISMAIPAGKFTCIMGASGIGKTTLLKIILGIIKPDSGSIKASSAIKISTVFQEDRLLESETALRNVLFVTSSSRANTARAEQLLKRAGLEEFMHKKTATLSGGMKRRVCICRALIADYDLLILDEPYKGLDETTKENMIQLILDCVPKTAAALCVTHDTSEAIRLGGHVITL